MTESTGSSDAPLRPVFAWDQLCVGRRSRLCLVVVGDPAGSCGVGDAGVLRVAEHQAENLGWLTTGVALDRNGHLFACLPGRKGQCAQLRDVNAYCPRRSTHIALKRGVPPA